MLSVAIKIMSVMKGLFFCLYCLPLRETWAFSVQDSNRHVVGICLENISTLWMPFLNDTFDEQIFLTFLNCNLSVVIAFYSQTLASSRRNVFCIIFHKK